MLIIVCSVIATGNVYYDIVTEVRFLTEFFQSSFLRHINFVKGLSSTVTVIHIKRSVRLILFLFYFLQILSFEENDIKINENIVLLVFI